MNYWVFVSFISAAFFVTRCTPAPVPYNAKQPIPYETITNEVPRPEKKKPPEWEEDLRYTFSGPWPKEEENLGSLWKEDNPWGNLFRDRRAAFVGDVLKITGVSTLVGNNSVASSTEKDVQEVNSSLKEITVQVVSILGNGLLAVQGEKIVYRDGNLIRYRTFFRGFLRPEDINRQNEIDAQKVFRPELSTNKGYRKDQIPKNREQLVQTQFDVSGNRIWLPPLQNVENSMRKAIQNPPPPVLPEKNSTDQIDGQTDQEMQTSAHVTPTVSTFPSPSSFVPTVGNQNDLTANQAQQNQGNNSNSLQNQNELTTTPQKPNAVSPNVNLQKQPNLIDVGISPP